MWPEITFRVNLELSSTELIGPNTNQTEQGVLHPDMFEGAGPDTGREQMSNRKNTRSTWVPDVLTGLNRAMKHGDQFTVTGLNALYIRDMYAIGYAPADRAVLEIV